MVATLSLADRQRYEEELIDQITRNSLFSIRVFSREEPVRWARMPPIGNLQTLAARRTSDDH